MRCDVEKSFAIRCDTSICSEHFLLTDYCGGEKKKGARLKRDAVPSVFVWTKEERQGFDVGCSSSSGRTARPSLKDRSQVKPAVVYGPPTYAEWLEKETDKARAKLEALQGELKRARTADAFSFDRFRAVPGKMAYYTGLPDGETFEVLFAFLGAPNEILFCPAGRSGLKIGVDQSVAGQRKRE